MGKVAEVHDVHPTADGRSQQFAGGRCPNLAFRVA